MKPYHNVILGLEVYYGSGIARLKELMDKVSEIADIERLSSIYRVLPEQAENLRSDNFKLFGRLAVVIRIKTDLEPKELFETLHEIESNIDEMKTQRAALLYLLLYDDLLLMNPELTLPYPKLHLKPHILVPAAEIAGDLEHPVLKESLAKLSSQIKNKNWGVFYAQGKSLLDFSH